MSNLKEAFKKIFQSGKTSSAGIFIDKTGKLAFRISEGWVMTEDRGQLVLRHEGVEFYAFTFHSGINYEYPERVMGVSPEEQKRRNL